MEDDKLSVFTLLWLVALTGFSTVYVIAHAKGWYVLVSDVISGSSNREHYSNRGIKKSAADAIASGEWKEQVDPTTGKKFYFNAASGKTTWDLDKELSSNS